MKRMNTTAEGELMGWVRGDSQEDLADKALDITETYFGHDQVKIRLSDQQMHSDNPFDPPTLGAASSLSFSAKFVGQISIGAQR